jgi:formamidopyrimidine-DNA glycosylase
VPELPEVESARAAIERAALNRTIADVDDSDTYECRPHRPGEIKAALVGRRLTATHRRGKTMWCDTSRGGPALGIHLGMAGRILVSRGARIDEGGDYARDAYSPLKPEWDRFTITFSDGGTLRLFDKRRLGRVRLDPDIDALGEDAGEIGVRAFREVVGRGTAPVKARLLDQSALAGVGNLLADESLWQARIDPRRPTGTLTQDELTSLHRQVRRAIRNAIRRGGVHTLAVLPYRKPDAHCPRCGTAMRRATVGGRTTWWCPKEQR